MQRLIGNRYQIIESVGEGGMGTVYKGRDNSTNQLIAIKRLKPDLAAPKLIERFKREGDALRELNHPNILKLLDTVEENGSHYLIIEYLAGGDLGELLKKEPLTVKQTLKLALEIADALTRAHHLDIIHRDLKPANVLIADDGTPRLSDFGIAHIGRKQRVTDPGMMVGTIDYLPPEIINGEDSDARSDIWAFGIMLFEMLTGKRPFSGDTPFHTMHAILSQSVPDLEISRSDAPIPFIDLIYRMLEKDRNARLRSVRHIGAELEDILYGREANKAPDSRFDTPIPETFARPKHNLPAQSTPFVGRERELDEVAKLLDDPKIRLMTILAPGGMGKTRLALEAANYQIPNYDSGVYFVELAPLSDHENMMTAIAEAASFQFQSDGRTQKQQVLDFLGNKTILLVLDNYEHLLDGAALVTDILKAAPDVKILVTSRQRLNQAGETLLHLSGMDFPSWETPADALEYAAVKLFMNSAQRAQPGFELTHDNLDYVARICRLVQGMPLGIVLAAAWLSMLSPQEIADELQRNIDILTDESGEVSERQQSIRAVFDYSWQSMDTDEQSIFMKLSVFRGGFTRNAGQTVTGANLRQLMSLVNKSLIRRDNNSGRYEIHELLRQYAEEKLNDARLVEIIQMAHASYFLNYAEEQLAIVEGEQQPEIIRNIQSDYDNIEAAWLYALEKQQIELLSDIANMMWAYEIWGWHEKALSLLGKTLEIVPEEQRILRGKLLSYMSTRTMRLSRHDLTEEYARRSIQLLQGTEAHTERLWAKVCLAIAFAYGPSNDFEAAEKINDEIHLEASTLGLKVLALSAISNTSILIANRGNYERALELALSTYDDTEANLWSRNHTTNILSSYYCILQDHDEAWRFAEETLNNAQKIEHQVMIFAASTMLAYLSFLKQDDEAVAGYLQVQRAAAYMLNYPILEPNSLEIRIGLRNGEVKRAKEALHGFIPQITGTRYDIEMLLAVADYLTLIAPTRFVITVLSYVKHHDDWWSKADAIRLLEKYQSSFEAGDYLAAYERGKTLDLKTVIQEWLAVYTEG